MMSRLLTILLFLILWSGAVWAGPGHDHGDDGGGAAATVDTSPSLESIGTVVELVARSTGHRLTLFLDRSDTNEPVDGAAIEVSGDGIETVLAKPAGPGTYELEADWVDQPGIWPLLFTVTTDGEVDLLNGTWKVAADRSTAPPGAPPLGNIIMQAEVLALLIGAILLGFVLAFAVRAKVRDHSQDPEAESNARIRTRSTLRHAAEMFLVTALLTAWLSTPTFAGPGHDHGDGGHDEGPVVATGSTPRKLPDGGVLIPKPTQRLLGLRTQPAASTTSSSVRELIGTVVPDPSSFGQVQAPMDGQIEVSERGISYVGQKVQAGEVLALLAPSIPVADLGTMQQLRAEVEGKLAVAQQKLDRLTRIADVIAKSQIEDTKAELAALREQKRVLEPKDTEKIPLKAPVSGIISVATVRAGQVVSARDTLFEIVDPDKLWVEGIGDAGHRYGPIVSAKAVDNEQHVLKLTYIGHSPMLRQQARPFLFRIEDRHPDLVIGTPLKVFVEADSPVEGIVLPATAVVRGNSGLPQVWIKDAPERFRPAQVRTQPLDGERVLVVAGIKPGDRVVTVAAELVNQVR